MNDVLPIEKTPTELPDGCTRKMQMHLNFGSKGGAATYSVHLPTGEQLPIVYQYDTQKKPDYETGFFFTFGTGDDPVYKKWSECKAAWPFARALKIKRKADAMTTLKEQS